MSVVAVIGLGYVGLPLVLAFGRLGRTIGFDIDQGKVDACRKGQDPSGEMTAADMAAAAQAHYTSDAQLLQQADFVVVAVPTPVDDAHIPNFGPLLGASRSIGCNLKPGAIIVFESTVYPGATEEVCVPVLERESGKIWKRDFFVAYSPERINPGDKEHQLANITKVVAGDTPETLDKVAALYEGIIKAGVYRAATIRTAEAAKVIENTQRDLNIALMNELAILFDRLGLDTGEVLAAAGTKWNFLKFKPGLVGGHCIGVDPYYLTHKAQMVGYHPEVILAGRRINDGMGKFIAEQTIKNMIASGSPVKGASVNVLGLTFKENCADLRNSRVIDIVRELQSYGATVCISDPLADAGLAKQEYGEDLMAWDDLPKAHALVLAVAHDSYAALTPAQIATKLVPGAVVVDVKSVLNRQAIAAAGFRLWRL